MPAAVGHRRRARGRPPPPQATPPGPGSISPAMDASTSGPRRPSGPSPAPREREGPDPKGREGEGSGAARPLPGALARPTLSRGAGEGLERLFARDRAVIIGGLAGLALAGWAHLLWLVYGRGP